MNRSHKGNMLVLSGAFVMVNAVALVVASSFGSLFFVHNRVQTFADELALEGARKLNEQDRIGQMNSMIARSRQLVYDADVANQQAQSNLNHLNDVAQQLYDEAHDGAQLLEQERMKLRTVSTTEASQAINKRYNELKNGYALVLPWLQSGSNATPVISFGCTKNVNSNVSELNGIDTLDSFDKSQSYITTDGSKLYKENINAKLEGSPSDLSFKISSLPAPVANNISPARTILAKSFRQVSGDQLYSTVQVQLQLDVSASVGTNAQSQMQARGTAEATGGQTLL